MIPLPIQMQNACQLNDRRICLTVINVIKIRPNFSIYLAFQLVFVLEILAVDKTSLNQFSANLMDEKIALFFRWSTPYQKKRVEWMQNWCCIGYKQIAKQRTFKARCVLTDFIATNANVSHLIRLINIEIVPCAMRNKCRLDRTERSFRYSVSRTHSFVCAPGCQECPAWKMFSTHWNKIYNYKKCHQVRAIHKIIIFLMSAHNQY